MRKRRTKGDNPSRLWIIGSAMISRCTNFLPCCLFLLFLVNIASRILSSKWNIIIQTFLYIRTWHSPHSGAVKMHHQPFARIKRDWIGVFYSLKPSTEFRAYECTACIGRVHVQPQSILFTCQFIRNMLTTKLNRIQTEPFALLTHLTNFFKIVKSTGTRCTQSSANLDKWTRTYVKEIWFLVNPKKFGSVDLNSSNIEMIFDQACREF